VEAGVPASGQRFTLEGIYDPQGKKLDLSRMHEPKTLAILASSMALPVCHNNNNWLSFQN